MSVHTTSRRRGFTAVEMLIAVAITAIVMAALCAAVNATVQSCRVNESLLESSGRARLAIGQIERTIRKADAVVRTSSTRLDIVDGDGVACAFVYDAATKQLNYLFGTPSTAATLARNISAVDFRAETEPDPDTQVSRIVRLTVDLTVMTNGESKRFTVSIAPRRARTYQ